MSTEKYDVPGMLRLTKRLHDKRIITSCLTCGNFDGVREECVLANQRPPVYVIAYGCPSWTDDRDLPF